MTTDDNIVTFVGGNSRSRLSIIPWTDLPDVLAIDSEIAQRRSERRRMPVAA